MTASLYQTASSRICPSMAESSCALCEVIAEPRNQGQTTSLWLRSSSSCAAHHLEDMSRELIRVQLDIVSWTTPAVSSTGKQVVHLESLVRGDVEARQVELHEAGLRMHEIQVDRGKDDVRVFALGIHHELRIVDGVE